MEGRPQLLVSDYEDHSPVDAFVGTVLDGEPNLSPAEDAARVVELAEAAYRSALGERLVRIEPHESSG